MGNASDETAGEGYPISRSPVHNGAVDLVCSRVVTYPYVVILMPLNIRSEETEELANALAKLTDRKSVV